MDEMALHIDRLRNELPHHEWISYIRSALAAREHKGYRDGIKDAMEAIAHVRERNREAVQS